MITITCSMVKYTQSRSPRIAYTTTEVTKVLDKEGWSWSIDRMILDFTKTFPDREAALQGRRSLDQALGSRLRRYRLDKVEEH